MSSRNDYLAKKYGTTSKNTKKTKKSGKSTTNYAIIDEDEFVGKWKNVSSDGDNDNDDAAPAVDYSELDNEEKSKRWRPIGADEDEEPQIVQDLTDSLDKAPVEDHSPKRKKRRTHSSDKRMASGLNVGLQTADEVKKDLERIEKETKDRLNMDPSRSGRDAETVYRDKHGKKIDIAAQRAEERRRIEEEEKYMKWGTEEQISKEEEMRNKPLAIYKDNKELNEELKSKERWNDPAALFLSKKSKKKEPSRPKYQGPPPPPNRFNIPPGYRWDGIDRSNGFERAYFEKRNARSAMTSEAYSWSVED
ncbi:3230_t:CDS:2, partial [Cetraspora pellucida]